MSRRARKLLLPLVGVTAVATALALQPGSAGASVAPTFRVTTLVRAGFNTHAVVFDSTVHEAYVAGSSHSRHTHPERTAVTVVDTVSRTVVANVLMPRAPSQLAGDSAQHAVYASVPIQAAHGGAPENGLVEVIDDQSHAITASITVGRGPAGMTVDPALDRLYVVNSLDKTVSVVNTSTDAVVTTVPLAGAPAGIVADPVTHRVYVAETSNQLEVIDGTTNTVITTVALTGTPYPLGVDPSTGTVYAGITVSSHAKIAAIDETTESETGTTAPLGVAYGVSTLTVNPTNHKVYAVAGFWARFVDGPTLSYNAKLNLHRSYGIDVDPATDTIYATLLGRGNPSGGGLYILNRTPH